MASSNGGEEQQRNTADTSQTLKEGERIVAPTRRPDGTLRKAIRIRPGFVPQEEVAKYQSKGALWKKQMEALSVVPPGYEPVTDAKPKTKSAKRNERKKEKRQLAAVEKNKNNGTAEGEEVVPTGNESPKSLTSQMNDLDVSETSAASTRAVSKDDADATEAADSGPSLSLVDKKIRALKKKIRLAEAQLQKVTPQDMTPEQLDKLAKLEGWRQELELMECRNAAS